LSEARYTRARAGDVEGFQHGQDDYWFRPLVFGQSLFTYLAYVPPGGSMPPHGHEEDPYELSFFMVAGELDVTLEADTFRALPGDAVHVQPTVSLGVRNPTPVTAVFLLTFNPPPPIGSLEKLRERYAARGVGIRPAARMDALWRPGDSGPGRASGGKG